MNFSKMIIWNMELHFLNYFIDLFGEDTKIDFFKS